VGTVGATNRELFVDNTGKIGYVPSTLRLKDNVRTLDDIGWLYHLRPVTFTDKSDENKVRQFGLVAEEVAQVVPEFVSHNTEGKPETVSYSSLIAPLLRAVQQQMEMIEKLQQEIDSLKRR
jgi:hypothetical protein